MLTRLAGAFCKGRVRPAYRSNTEKGRTMKRLFALSLAAALLLSSACFASGSNHKFNTSLRFMLDHREDP